MALFIGQILNGRYRIDGFLSQGGFGAVYLAYDQNLDVPVAVKESLDVSPEAEINFKREARLLLNLHHPNLPRVLDRFGLPGAGQYLVMEYIDGQDLQALMDERRDQPLPISLAL